MKNTNTEAAQRSRPAMNARWLIWLGLIWLGMTCTTTSVVNVKDALGEEQSASEAVSSESGTPQPLGAHAETNDGLSIEVARDRAELMHDIYAATLEVLHHRYFHRDRAIIPARAMQDIFSKIERQSKTEARWISASMKPMSVDHEPTSEFEKRAAKEIAAGTEQLEVIEGGYYRRAGAIPLGDGCVGCHGGFFKPQSKMPQFAGLVISVPLRAGDAVASERPDVGRE